ncbi:hypothetical protein MASR1M66_05940 [Aminivibrio sp.]
MPASYPGRKASEEEGPAPQTEGKGDERLGKGVKDGRDERVKKDARRSQPQKKHKARPPYIPEGGFAQSDHLKGENKKQTVQPVLVVGKGSR